MHLDHVSHLWVWVLPYLSSYVFLFPFGWQPSLLDPSCSHWGIQLSLRLAYSNVSTFISDLIGIAKFHIVEMHSGWASSILRGRGVLTYWRRDQ